MLRKIVSGLVLITVLVGMLTFTFNIQLLRASGTIYIRADGSVEGTDKIQRDGDIYTFIDNIYDSIVVERDDIVVDGAGYTLQGMPQSTGITLEVRNNVTIKNVEIKEFQFGILLLFSSMCHMLRNTLTLCFEYGIGLVSSSGNRIYGNNITRNDNGIFSSDSSDNNIFQNNVTTNGLLSIWLRDSSNNTISGNNIKDNYYGMHLWRCPDNLISGNHITNNHFGIDLYKSSNNTISGNNITDNDHCINLISTNQNEISYNSILNNYLGIGGNESQSNLIHNNILANNSIGLRLTNSNNTEIRSNIITQSKSIGIRLESSSEVMRSFDNIVTENVINFTKGTGLEIDYAITKTYHNNFIQNTNHAYVKLPAETQNVWDDGYPSGGNYWGDYIVTDVRWGEDQDLEGSDMIGDSPYMINERNKDRYPLTEPWPMSNCWYFEDDYVMAITSSSIKKFSFNKKVGEMSFNIATDTSDSCKVIISKRLLDGAFNFLIDNATSPCSIRWSSDFHMLNFTYSQGTHGVKILGEFVLRYDLNNDRKIDIKDIATIAKHYGEKAEDP